MVNDGDFRRFSFYFALSTYLESERNTPAPLGLVTNEASEDTSTDDVADNPAHVDVGGAIVAESEGKDLDGVGRRNDVQSSPRKTTKDLAGEEHAEILGREAKSEETAKEGEGDDHDPAVTKAANVS